MKAGIDRAGERVLTGEYGGTVRVFDVVSAQERLAIDNGSSVWALEWSPDVQSEG